MYSSFLSFVFVASIPSETKSTQTTEDPNSRSKFTGQAFHRPTHKGVVWVTLQHLESGQEFRVVTVHNSVPEFSPNFYPHTVANGRARLDHSVLLELLEILQTVVLDKEDCFQRLRTEFSRDPRKVEQEFRAIQQALQDSRGHEGGKSSFSSSSSSSSVHHPDGDGMSEVEEEILRLPTILCGDFNSTPQSAQLEFLKHGRLLRPADGLLSSSSSSSSSSADEGKDDESSLLDPERIGVNSSAHPPLPDELQVEDWNSLPNLSYRARKTLWEAQCLRVPLPLRTLLTGEDLWWRRRTIQGVSKEQRKDGPMEHGHDDHDHPSSLVTDNNDNIHTAEEGRNNDRNGDDDDDEIPESNPKILFPNIRSPFVSAYEEILGEEPEFTNVYLKQEFIGTLDYIMFSKAPGVFLSPPCRCILFLLFLSSCFEVFSIPHSLMLLPLPSFSFFRSTFLSFLFSSILLLFHSTLLLLCLSDGFASLFSF